MHAVVPVLLLICSNVFMTFAWYGHLKFKSTALWVVILVSWGIAFFEYCLQVPANRMGHEFYSAAQLKGLQEIITNLSGEKSRIASNTSESHPFRGGSTIMTLG